jgi:crotonobetainyl-CoA:carnitine CoA-transferase CaiB-like acyl-CoA transferase
MRCEFLWAARSSASRKCALNTYRSSDGTWFVLVVTPDKVPAVLKGIGREDILTDPRFSDPAKLAQNRPQLTSMLDEIFSSQPISHWYEVFNGVQVTFGALREPQEADNDPQLRANDIIVPLEGAGEKLTSTLGGVYVEMEAIALSRGIPVEFLWLVKPLTEKVARDIMFKMLDDTGAAVRRETESASDKNQHIVQNSTPVTNAR